VPTYEVKLKKLVVFVPVEDSQKVKEALGNAGAGAIGNYSHCLFTTTGTGQFLPDDESNPYIGQSGLLEHVEEERIETIFPDYLEKSVIQQMLKVHPYEEVAYDIYPLENKGETLGLGRIGQIEETTLGDFVYKVKKVLEVPTVRVVGNLDAKIKKVAVLGGDGNKYISAAKFKGADVYITGDLYYHVAHDAMMMGLNVIDPGHNVEKVMKRGIAHSLTKICSDKGFDVVIFPSEQNTEPFQFI